MDGRGWRCPLRFRDFGLRVPGPVLKQYLRAGHRGGRGGPPQAPPLASPSPGVNKRTQPLRPMEGASRVGAVPCKPNAGRRLFPRRCLGSELPPRGPRRSARGAAPSAPGAQEDPAHCAAATSTGLKDPQKPLGRWDSRAMCPQAPAPSWDKYTRIPGVPAHRLPVMRPSGQRSRISVPGPS